MRVIIAGGCLSVTSGTPFPLVPTCFVCICFSLALKFYALKQQQKIRKTKQTLSKFYGYLVGSPLLISAPF